MSRYRSSREEDLAYGDDYSSAGGPQRWDRARFEKMRGSRPSGSRYSEDIKFEEDSVSTRGGGRERDVKLDFEEDRRRGPPRRDFYDHYPYDDERYEAPRRPRPSYLDEDVRVTTGREVAPYRPKAEAEYEYDVQSRRSSRPQNIKRASSYDSHQRRSRYDDEEYDERDINVNVNLRAPEELRSPPPDPRMEYRDEDYRDIRIRRETEREVFRRRRSSSSDSFKEVKEEVKEKKPKHKRGKTRMPKRLVHLRAVLDLQEPYEEEDYFYVVLCALSKEEIDVVIDKSKTYFKETTTTYKVDETKLLEAPVPPPPQTYYAPPPASERSVSVKESVKESVDESDSREEQGGETEVIETHTTRIIENPTEEELAQYRRAAEGDNESVKSPSVAPSARSHHSHKSKSVKSAKSSRRSSSSSSSSTTTIQQSDNFSKHISTSIRSPSPTRTSRSKSRPRGDEIFEEKDRSTSESLTLVLPSRGKSRTRREIDDEIRRLEHEKHKIQREGRRELESLESPRDYEYEIVARDVRLDKDEHGELRLERDAPRRRSRSRRRGPTQRDINAALFSLT